MRGRTGGGKRIPSVPAHRTHAPEDDYGASRPPRAQVGPSMAPDARRAQNGETGLMDSFATLGSSTWMGLRMTCQGKKFRIFTFSRTRRRSREMRKVTGVDCTWDVTSDEPGPARVPRGTPTRPRGGAAAGIGPPPSRQHPRRCLLTEPAASRCHAWCFACPESLPPTPLTLGGTSPRALDMHLTCPLSPKLLPAPHKPPPPWH